MQLSQTVLVLNSAHEEVSAHITTIQQKRWVHVPRTKQLEKHSETN